MELTNLDIIIDKVHGELIQSITQEIIIFFDKKGIIKECNVTGIK